MKRLYSLLIIAILLNIAALATFSTAEEMDNPSEQMVISIEDSASASKPKSIKVSGSKYVAVGKKITLTATILPAEASQKVTWKSSNKKVATVTSKGVVKGIKAGKASIIVTSKSNKSVVATYKLTVLNSATTKVRFMKYGDVIDLAEGNKLQMEAKASPSDAAQVFSWTSDDKKVATVNNKGVVTGKKPGLVMITAQAKDGSKKKASRLITVGNSVNPPDTLTYKGAEYYLGGNSGLYYVMYLWNTEMPEKYYVDQPVTIKFDLVGGAPPFQVEMRISEGDEMESCYSPLTEYIRDTGYQLPSVSFTTNERHIEWIFTPIIAGGPLSVWPLVYDVNGMETDVATERMVLPCGETLSWKYQYFNFLFNGGYWEYDNYFEIGDMSPDIAIFDVDKDGTPELLIHSADESMAGSTYLTFTFKNGAVVYVGDIGFRECMLSYSKDSRYPGVFCIDGNMGYYETVYYELSNSSIQAESVLAEDYTWGDEYTWHEPPQITIITGDEALANIAQNGPLYGIRTMNINDLSEDNWNAFVTENRR